MAERVDAAVDHASQGSKRTALGLAAIALAAFVVAWFVGLATPERQFATFVLLGLGLALVVAWFAWVTAGRASTPGGTWFVRVYFAALALTTAALLYALSVPGPSFAVLVFALPAFALLFTIWLFAVLTVLWRRVLGQGFRAALRGREFAWTAPPLVVCVLAALALVDLPLRARFALGRSEFEALVERARLEPALVNAELAVWGAHELHFIGTYPICRVDTYPGGARFLVAGSGFLDSCGFAYSERGAPPNLDNEYFYEPFWGDWYLWRQSW